MTIPFHKEQARWKCEIVSDPQTAAVCYTLSVFGSNRLHKCILCMDSWIAVPGPNLLHSCAIYWLLWHASLETGEPESVTSTHTHTRVCCQSVMRCTDDHSKWHKRISQAMHYTWAAVYHTTYAVLHSVLCYVMSFICLHETLSLTAW